LFCCCFVVVVAVAVVIVVVVRCCCCSLLLLVVIFDGGIVVVFLFWLLIFFFSYSNFAYKVGGFKALLKWVSMDYKSANTLVPPTPFQGGGRNAHRL
jgi:hypothetical protein